MPYLNWTETEILPVSSEHPRWGTQLDLALSAERIVTLVDSLAPVFAKAGSELRIDFPSKWTLYWKIREGDTRLLLAHPDADAWVGTVALNPEQAESFLMRLRGLSLPEANSIQMSELPGVSRPSNLELVLRLR